MYTKIIHIHIHLLSAGNPRTYLVPYLYALFYVFSMLFGVLLVFRYLMPYPYLLPLPYLPMPYILHIHMLTKRLHILNYCCILFSPIIILLL